MAGSRGDVWKRTGFAISPGTSREVMSVIGSIGVYSSNQRFAWRGMSSADYDVQSSLHRLLGHNTTESDLRAAEIGILKEARDWGLGVGESTHVDDLGLLADLQHYGVPIRLIDFTSNPMTALWFACQTPHDNTASRSGVVVALNVTKLKKYASVGNAYSNTWVGLENPSGSTLASALATPQPFVVESSHPNDRLRAQEGFFVAGAVPTTSSFARRLTSPFFSIGVEFKSGADGETERRLTSARGQGAPNSLPFVAVVISAGLKQKLRSYLEGTFNRRAKVLFPDFAGFKDLSSYPSLRNKYATKASP